jgi:biotin carboxyl carrier protein
VLLIDNRLVEVLAQDAAQGFNVQISGRSYEVETTRRGARRREQQDDQFVEGKWQLRAPLTGVVTEVRVAAGHVVERGDVLLVVEAMKMLNELRARVPGVVASVAVSEKDRVEIGTVLVVVSEAGSA